MRFAWAWLAAGALVSIGARAAGPASTPFSPSADLTLETVATGLDHPVHLTAPPGDPRLFVVEQPGRIRIVRAGRVLERPFLDLTDRVRWGGERGLLSVAFHPAYARNGWLFVNYTDRRGDTRIERYSVSRDPDVADRSSARLILTIAQPYANHNGGLVAFAPDGMLWIGMGDGGSAGDPHGNGQNLQSLLGKMLRIDVDHGNPYGIPRDNPFVGRSGARPEIWASGLRNPWRFSFDRSTGQVYIADVGQDRWEEVDVSPIATGGLNYGWNLMEGNHCFLHSDCDAAGLTLPTFEYGHDQGCSVTGGAVYRGSLCPALRGRYFFSDYCKGWIRSFRTVNGRAADFEEWRLPGRSAPGRAGAVTSFGEDAGGEIYVVCYDGRILRLAQSGRGETRR